MSGRIPPLYCTLTLIAMQGQYIVKSIVLMSIIVVFKEKSEHPPVIGGKMSKRLGGIKGCKYKTSSVVVVSHIQRIGCQPHRTTQE